MRVRCQCGAIPCWFYAPSGERKMEDRILCADCVSRSGDALPGFPDHPITNWRGEEIPAVYHEWPNPNGYTYGTPGYWLVIDPDDKHGRPLPDCEYVWVGYHKRKWQWLKKRAFSPISV